MKYTTILVDRIDGILKITLNLPERLNALDLVMREELKEVFLEARDDRSVRVVVVFGAGEAFCAGGDIGTMQGVDAPAGRERLKRIQQLVGLMVELEKPIIAAVNGFATGAGLNLALACDMIIASDRAKFRESFVMIGLIPDLGGFYFLPLRVGVPKAKELMMTGRMLDAQEAESMGLVNRVVPHQDLEKETMDLARGLAGGPGRAYAMIKSALKLWPSSLQTLMELEANLQAVAFATRDFDEGRQAFLEKRKPKFTGE